MKISYNWLKEFTDIDVSAQRLRQDLTTIGLPVESITQENGDVLFEMEVTSNRPDCLNHLGVAREVATLYDKPLKQPEPVEPQLETETEMPYSVDIDDSKLCRRYSALLMSGVKVEPSPPWLRERLQALGQRPVNNIVDITNYVLLELGHPLHAFDFAKLEGGKIIVRTARNNESIVTLDGIKRSLDSSMLVIADASKPVALAGVMGGLESEIFDATTTVLLESAYFDPRTVRRTAKRLGLSTEASYRFERGADINATVKSLLRTKQLISEVAGGKVSGPLIDRYPRPLKEKSVKLRHKRASQMIGVDFEKEFIEAKLASLGFEVAKLSTGVWKVKPPSHRVDIGLEADLIEEVARFYGYDKVPTTLPSWVGKGNFPPHYEKETTVCRTLKALGYSEVMNWSFLNASEENIFRSDTVEPLVITNAISEVDSVLRTSLLPSLLRVVRENFDHGSKNVKIFELGKSYFSKESTPDERKRLALAATGQVTEVSWAAKAEDVTFHHLKGAVEALLGALRQSSHEIRPIQTAFFHPNISAAIYRDEDLLGVLGRLHPKLEEQYKFKQDVFLAELDIEKIFSLPTPEIKYKRLPKFPAVFRDISFSVDNETEYNRMERRILSCGISELVEVRLFDVYQGEQITAGKKSMSIRLKFLSPERTLTDEEVTEFTNKIRGLLREEFDADLR